MPIIPIPQPKRATEAQQNYIEILTGDLLFSRKARNSYISEIVGREIRFLDELTMGEADSVIAIFLDWKHPW